jgi:hypothetical protein
MRRLLVVCAAMAVLAPFRAEALTVRDVIELSRAGLGEETLMALIEVDPSVFPIDTATLKSLKAAGVSERVIVAMVRSARVQPEPPPSDFVPEAQLRAQPVEPQVIVVDHHDSAPAVREIPVAVPVYIPIERHHRDRDGDRRADGNRGDGDDRNGHTKAKAAEPVYWGFGGKLRPDAWQPK